MRERGKGRKGGKEGERKREERVGRKNEKKGGRTEG